MLLLLFLALCGQAQDLKFTSPVDLQNIIYDTTSKRVFVAGTNLIIRLSDELSSNQQLATGPFPDDPNCYDGGSCDKRVPSDNRNQVLIISNALLIHCGTAYGGRCNASDPATLAVSSYKSSNSTSNRGLSSGQGLYVAVDITNKQYSLGFGFPMIASYYLNVLERGNMMFQRVPNGRWVYKTPVNFKYMFSDASSFYTVGQMTLSKKPFIARVCNRDEGRSLGMTKEYTSYIETYLKCGSTEGRAIMEYSSLTQVVLGRVATNLANTLPGAEAGDDLLLGLFFDPTTRRYAMCAYMKKAIDTLFDSKSSSDICDHNVGSIGDTDTISTEPLHVLELGSTNATDIKLFKIKDDNVAIVSMYNGSTIKVVLRPGRVWTKTDLLSDQPVLQLVASSTRLYALSKSQVTGALLGVCQSYSTCEQCVESREPFCGWCVLRSKCSQISECAPDIKQFIPELWVNSASEGLCFPITNISPTSARIVNSTDVSVSAKLLVQALRGRSVFCDWGERGTTRYISSTPLTFNLNTVSCRSPPNLSPDLIPATTDSLKINITLRESAGDTYFMTLVQDFPLFYCPNNRACYNCTSGSYPCKWCKDTNRCRHTSEACSTGDAAPTSVQCPRLTSKTYLVESKGSGRLSLDATNIPTSTLSNYKCVLALGYRTISLAASSSVNSISCNIPIEVVRASGQPNKVPLVVTFKDVPILNPDNTAIVTLYSCEATSDCSACKGMDSVYGCGWCTSVRKCYPSVECEDRNLVKEDKCSDPGPLISQIIPSAGPVQGGTKLLILGTDLSIQYKDIRSVRVANRDCIVIREDYRVSTQVRCITAAVERPDDGAVSLDSVNGPASSQNIRFYYKVPIVQNVSPTKVLVTGGTRVTLLGSELTIGSARSVVLAATPCDLINGGSSTPLVCVTRAVSQPDSGKITLTIDRGSFSNDQLFSYVAVPSITEVTPFKSIQSGGINITFTGSGDFKPITSVQILLSLNNKNISSVAPCSPVVTDDEIRCSTPVLLPGTRVANGGTTVNISLILENNYSMLLQFTPFTIFPNPRVDVEDDKLYLEGGQTLVIKGKYFDRVLGIQVYINDMLCLNITPADTLISCIVPQLFTESEGQDGNSRQKRAAEEGAGDEDQQATIEREVMIQVRLGNFQSVPFSAVYVQRVPVGSNVMATMAASVGAGVVVLLLLFAVCFLYRRKLQQKKQFKHIMLQEMERIEHRLAEECKQVFTELQTDLADLNSDFSPATIPYLSFDEYAVKVLFPGQEEHPVLQPLDEAVAADHCEALATFEKLIYRDQFLVTLVEVLEGQRQVSKRDRSNIAALMIVSLMNNMTYTTTILKTLLSDLISQAMVNDGRRAKLLLRRTDHIAEKYLSNWLTFNLHSFLCEAAGQPLYVLYRAIKQQIEKGPVDYITGNARYALLEKNLLSKMLEFQKLNVMVYLEDDPYLRETDYTPLKSSQVALLSCDTISQAKAKIIDAMYKAVPDSLKPTPNDVDVEWKNGRSSSLRLVDMLHNTQDGWKQLDTLGTLNIDDQAVFQCIPRQSPPPFMSQNGGAPSCNSLLREIESGRVWHLERELDCDSEGKPMSGVKSVPEVFLTRLSATKIPLQKFVDDLFDVIFTPTQGIIGLPPCIKYIMDLLDREAAKHGITDPEIIHTWKNNSIPLRFWISIIKSPDVVFDVRKNNNIDSCLSVIAQTFIDACYYEDMMIDKTSQSSRLLYCKEIPTYKQHVREYFGEIQACMPVSEADIDSAFQQSKAQPVQLNQQSALYELYIYACRFSEELIDSLQDKGLGDLANQFLAISDSHPQV